MAARAHIEPPAVSGLRASLSAVLSSLMVFFGGPVAFAGNVFSAGRAPNATASTSTPPTGSSGTAGAISAGNVASAENLARTNRVMLSVQAMQQAARAAVSGPAVPNGLVNGGLEVDPGITGNPALWVGAQLPVQQVSSGKTKVTVKQTSEQALLNWKTFNVGKQTTLAFDQSDGGSDASKWIAFNTVNDPSANPTRILGSITAPGQVYIINRNGIIFGGSSQVNTHALVASTLPINANLIERGLLNNPDAEFLFSATELNNQGAGAVAAGTYGDVLVEAGAQITAPTTADHVGGRVALFGANVTNAGTISTPDGQTILAAGLQIGLAAHNSDDASLRGLDVYVGRANTSDGAGTVINSGLIEAARAAVALAGRDVRQDGVVNSTTSVSYNGRVDLTASYGAVSSGGAEGIAPFLPTKTGVVTLGSNSVLRILPEIDSKEKVVGAALALGSKVNIEANVVHFDTDSTLLAPGAEVNVRAGNWLKTGSGATLRDQFGLTDGQIYLDKGAVIDVAGSAGVAASVTDNIVEVELRGTELADSPLQRDGALRGQTVNVDIRQTGSFNGVTWIGTPVGDVSGYANLVERSVGELTVDGGNVNLSAGDSVVLREGSQVNVSGGSIDYAAGLVRTSSVRTSDGRIIDIADATPDQVYAGLYDGTTTVSDAKWGVSKSYVNKLFNGTRYESAYTYGGDAGTVSITAPSMAVEGTLQGTTVVGDRQLDVSPSGGGLKLAFTNQYQDPANNALLLAHSPSAPLVTFAAAPVQAAVADFEIGADGKAIELDDSHIATVEVDTGLFSNSGFGSLSIENSDGDIILPSGEALRVEHGGVISLSGANVVLNGDITAPGAVLTVSAFNVSPYLLGTDVPVFTPDRGRVTVGSSARISTAGRVLDGSSVADAGVVRTLDGGSVTLKGYSVDLASGSLIDVSGGAYVAPSGRADYGDAGGITLAAGRDFSFASFNGGTLSLGGELRGYSGAKSGSLSLQAPAVLIGAGEAPAGTLVLGGGFFDQGGFASFSIKGLGLPGRADIAAVRVTSGTALSPTVSSVQVVQRSDAGYELKTVLLDEAERTPVSISLGATGLLDSFSPNVVLARGDVDVEAGAVVDAGARGSVTLAAQTVHVGGSVLAAGGEIKVAGADNTITVEPNNVTAPVTTVVLDSGSVLSTAGKTVLVPDGLGFRTGEVLAGGTIAVSGNILAREGARLDVSGASGTLDLSANLVTAPANQNTITQIQNRVATKVDSDGGKITLTGSEFLYSDAKLTGSAGGSNAQAGRLEVSSSRYYPAGVDDAPSDVNLSVTSAGSTLAGLAAVGVGDSIAASGGLGHVTAAKINAGGFAEVELGGNVEFNGDVSLSAGRSVELADGGFLYAEGNVSIHAPYVKLGTDFLAPRLDSEEIAPFTLDGSAYHQAAIYGSGRLDVSASTLIDIGNLSLQNIGSARFAAVGGDIRGDGTLSAAGDLSFAAGQVYVPTAVDFTIAVANYTTGGSSHAGTVTFNSGRDRSLPLSAGGTLNVYAASIDQSGVLRAPIGSINLGWDGAGTAPVNAISGQSVAVAQTVVLGAGGETSVSAVDPLTGKALSIPYGVYLNGTQWIDPTSLDITSGGGPVKSVKISGVNVTTEKGAKVDVRGGGDLYAYRWVPGTGGTVDVLANEGAFAVIPGYGAGYAPYAAYNKTSLNDNLGDDAGYVNSTLSVGDSVYLAGGGGMAGGFYTLLPARYALLPGAFLVVPGTTLPAQTAVRQNDGSYSVSGYRYNALSGAPAGPVLSSFDIVPADVLAKRVEYDGVNANRVLAAGALAADLAVPRLPEDSGQLVLAATTSMNLAGSVMASAPKGARGGLVDISSPGNIVVTDADSVPSVPGALMLNVGQLNAYGSESLLIGGVRRDTTTGTAVTVTAANVTLDNPDIALSGSDIILAGTDSVSLSSGSSIVASGSASGKTDTLVIGSAASTGSGTGAAIRVGTTVSSIDRRGVDSSGDALLSVSDGVLLSGKSIVLDSSNSSLLDPGARFNADAVSLNSGRVSLLLDGASAPLSGAGLVLSGAALASLQGSVDALSFLSYTTIDIYGSGSVGNVDSEGVPVVSSLAFKSGGFRGFDTGDGEVTFAARTITVDNSPGSAAPLAVAAATGSLNFIAQTLKLGSGHVEVSQFNKLSVDASAGVVTTGEGSLGINGDMVMHTPVVTASMGADYDIQAAGDVVLASRSASSPAPGAGLGASLSIQGATVSSAASILLPSGTVKLAATSGDVKVSGLVDVAGVTKSIQEATVQTDGGRIELASSGGSVVLTPGAVLDVSAPSAGGAAGLVDVSAVDGKLVLEGTLHGTASSPGEGGSFALHVGKLADLSDIDPVLNAGGFDAVRDIRVRSGDVRIDDLAKVRDFSLTADAGSISVGGTGKIDASGKTGGAIALNASGSVVLEDGSQLTVAADGFSAAGKGGKIDLSAGSEVDGVINTAALLDIQEGASIDLSVAAAADPTLGLAAGVLHLRAPQNSAATDLQISAINGDVIGASRIVVEGYKLFDLSNAAGSTITTAVQGNVKTNATAFIGNTASIAARLLTSNAGLAPVLSIEPGSEIINRTGDLTLAATWDLSATRFGTASVPGNLSLRAAGNLIFTFKASLNDGFAGATYTSVMLDPGVRSWSYELTAGSDFKSADTMRVRSPDELATGKGQVLFGQGAGTLPTTGSSNLKRSSIIPNFYQVIRTGTGDIDIAAGRDVQMLNPLGTIYTAGTQAADLADFDRPATPSSLVNFSNIGTNQAPYFRAQYSLAGGDVSITAGNDIIRLVNGQADSTREMPTNWLYRRGYVDQATGDFGKTINSASVEISSTSWWIDYSNFFQGVGALGGGNVNLVAGRDVVNVDAVVPTNARMTKGNPASAVLQELGGGDLIVRAGRDIDGGVYYVERGSGALSAGDDIQTNSTRAALSRLTISSSPTTPDSSTWLPTTLFVGKSTFDVSAGDDLLLGPVANAFWLPQGINNNLVQKTYFTTYSADSGVFVSSLIGSVDLKSDPAGHSGSLLAWYQNVLQFFQNPGSFPDSQPWLRTIETNHSLFTTAATLLPPTLGVTAVSGDINLVGKLTLAPSPSGNIGLLAAQSINGLQVNGLSQDGLRTWSTSAINLSDADPAALPGIRSPINMTGQTTTSGSGWLTTTTDLFLNLNGLFAESGSITGAQAVIQTKQNLHGTIDGGTLHDGDSEPVRIYAGNGDISGLTLFAGKPTEVLAGRDISDLAIYVQNNRDTDVTRIVAGRDLVPYATATPLRLAAQTDGNTLLVSGSATPGPLSGNPTAGDIQIAGPGTLQLVAGRDFDLGAVKNNVDGTAAGVTSVGNARNPHLPFAGASIEIAAGVGSSVTGDVDGFNARFLDPATAGANAERYLPVLAGLIDLKGTDNEAVWTAYSNFPAGVRARLTLAMFYRVLRDAGRDHNSPDSDTFGTYDNGFAAIKALFPGKAWDGDVSIDSRLIKTANGGDIAIYAPGGSLNLGSNRAGNSDANQGILTEAGGDISIFTHGDVAVGTSRIFTLRGGNEIIWSSTGDIAAGISSKTVQSAPPTRVLIDPQSGDVETDLAGLATGGGIGVLETVAGLPPSDVDLIAPVGTIDAGDAGIRSSGNLNVAAAQILNATNIQVSGSSAGTATVAVPSLGSLVAAAGTTNTTAAASEQTRQTANAAQTRTEMPSIYSIEVIGYGGGGGSDETTDTGSAPASDLTVSYSPPALAPVL
jgi:filamentous hemagglutinin